MLLSAVAILVGVLIGLATGGRLRYAARRHIHWWGLVVVGLGLEVAADRWLSGGAGYLALVAGPICLLAWAAINVRLAGPGVALAAVGVTANLVVVGVDRGMPVERSALVNAGLARPTELITAISGHRHHLARAGDHLRFLDDRIPLRVGREVVSVGDIVLAAGVAVVVVHLLWYQARYQRSRRPRWLRAGLGDPLNDRLDAAG